MTTRRERLERKVEKRGEWAGKARQRSEARFAGVARIADGIPLGQPILVGHHSERRHRRDADRIHNGMRKGFEEQKLAQHHESKASGLERQLERSIFDDDPDAIEQLEAKISDLQQKVDRAKAVNRAWRKGGYEAVKAEFSQNMAEACKEVMAPGWSWVKSPCETTSWTTEIRRCRARIENIRAKRVRAEQAEAAGGVFIEGQDWVRVTFPEKPEREILESLRESGFRWGNGSWQGAREKLPARVLELAGGAS